MDSWYRHGLMVIITPMVLTETLGIVLVLQNHTHTRGLSVALMRDFLDFLMMLYTMPLSVLGYMFALNRA